MAASELRKSGGTASVEDGEFSGGIKDDDVCIISIPEEKQLSPEYNKIQKLPPQLREKQNNEFFDPTIVSIGPYHHGKPELEEMENWKIRMARAFIAESEVDANEFRNKIFKMVSDARNCYASGSTVAYDDEEFGRMMVVDGCFLLHLIVEYVQHQSGDLIEFLGNLGYGRIPKLWGDLILVENQLPFLVLQTLMSTRFPEDKGQGLIETFIDLIFIFDPKALAKMRSGQCQYGTKYDGDDQGPPLHLLELVRRRFIGSHSKREDVDPPKPPCCSWFRLRRGGHRETMPKKRSLNHSFRSATELKARGIKFRPSTTLFLNDFTFTSGFLYGRLTLPPLTVSNQTKRIFLNMMADELSPFRFTDFEVCSFIYFITTLINGADDVIELRSQNVIRNSLGTDEEVANVFNTLAAFYVLTPPSSKIIDVIDGIQAHYSSKRKTWTAQLLHNYFSTPWTALALFAATFALVLTFIQTLFPRDPHSRFN